MKEESCNKQENWLDVMTQLLRNNGVYVVIWSLSHVCLMRCSLPGSSVLGIPQSRTLEWIAISFSRGSSWPRDWTHISYLAGRFFTTEPPGNPVSMCTHIIWSDTWGECVILSQFPVLTQVHTHPSVMFLRLSNSKHHWIYSRSMAPADKLHKAIMHKFKLMIFVTNLSSSGA